MIQQYYSRLRFLQEDRSEFQKNIERKSHHYKMLKQEQKYQAYIVDQMNYKDKLISVNAIKQVLQSKISNMFMSFFGNCLKQNHQKRSMVSSGKIKNGLQIEQSSRSTCPQDESMNVDLVVVKLYLNVIERSIKSLRKQKIKIGFRSLIQANDKIKKINCMVFIFDKYSKRVCFRQIQLNSSRQYFKQIESKRYFEQSFSAIIKNGTQKTQNNQINCLEESDIVFLDDKDNICSTQQFEAILNIKKNEIQHQQQEMDILRSLLSQKAVQISKLNQQKMKMRQYYEEKMKKLMDETNIKNKLQIMNQTQQINSKNESYYSQISRMVKGDRKQIRKNNRSQSRVNSRAEMEKELLGKYMRQSFQLRQNMDVARQLCIDAQKMNIGNEARQKIAEVLKVLKSENFSILDQV